MDPTGGAGCWAVLILLVIVALLFAFAPLHWAIGVSAVLGIIVIGFVIYVFSSAHYT